VTPEESVAQWAARPIALDGGNWFTPLVAGPSAIPQVTDEAAAAHDPELAVLSAMAHGGREDPNRAAAIASAALRASVALDPDRSQLYFDLILASLSEAARRELQAMDPAKYEFQSEFARRYIALGKEEGKAEGRAELVKRQLALRFGTLPPEAAAHVSAASIEELDAIGARLLIAPTLEEALGRGSVAS
jgi:hypothetical protein